MGENHGIQRTGCLVSLVDGIKFRPQRLLRIRTSINPNPMQIVQLIFVKTVEDPGH